MLFCTCGGSFLHESNQRVKRPPTGKARQLIFFLLMTWRFTQNERNLVWRVCWIMNTFVDSTLRNFWRWRKQCRSYPAVSTWTFWKLQNVAICTCLHLHRNLLWFQYSIQYLKLTIKFHISLFKCSPLLLNIWTQSNKSYKN